MIQGIDDVLTPLATQRTNHIKSMACPRCRSAMSPQLYTPNVFSPDDPLPRMMAWCQDCNSTIDPRTGIVLDTGDPRRVEEALPLIRSGHDD
jgi:hypothetical protein